MFDKLAAHKIVAWDFDQTLVQHPASALMWDFIIRNPYDQVHHIVTMRSHGMQHDIMPIFERWDSGLSQVHFEQVINLPDDIFTSFYNDQCLGIDTQEHPYRYWKGMICEGLGATVLVDDMEAMNASTAGCIRHGIEHIHPDAFL